ncbi:hypothetical protein AD952_13155 [Acetobacter cerevisiae]|uniref:Uncharacterized protein n=1 Tax=Acetobacter cerevisiae TaxID=178900 RepID=A0A149URA6_9PROT|nr:DUF6118 family protein [Acetobacter cerevisiae]KXV70374.1 hypothetical protein AD952_13155 [Acetobacter cerevisiae]KXV77979.1 hypothetical protein AD954_04920 [Acetobacter cerevisiae]
MSEADSAAQAFDDLRAEVSVLRRAVEALPLAWRDNRPPDYTEDLARVVKAMNAVGTHMKAIEASPTLKMAPQAYGQGIREEGLAASRRLEGVFEKAIGEVRKERQALASIVGEANNRRDQWFYLIFIGLMAFLFGVGVAPLLFNHITWKNFDERVASFIVGGQDRWESGAAMMRDARPEQWNSFMWEDRLVQDNMPKIRDCRIAATQVGQPKSCVITIKPDAQ